MNRYRLVVSVLTLVLAWAVYLPMQAQTVTDTCLPGATLPGDVNRDGIVDIADYTLLSVNYVPEADINQDQVIDIYDLVWIGRYYNLTCADFAPTDTPVLETQESEISADLTEVFTEEATVDLTPVETVTNTPSPTPAEPIYTSPGIEAEALPLSSNWTRYDSAVASSGAYMYSSSSTEDSISFRFTGTQLEILYVQHPALGSFVVDIDGQVVQIVDTSGEEALPLSVIFTDLDDTLHNLNVYPAEGMIALDAFLITAPESEASVTSEATDHEIPGETETPTLEVTSEDFSTLTVTPTYEETSEELPTQSATPTETSEAGSTPTPTPTYEAYPEYTSTPSLTFTPEITPTATMTPQPVNLPFYVSVDSNLWTTDGGWQIIPYLDRLAWQAGTQNGILSLIVPVDLRGTSNPHLQFQSLLISQGSSAFIEVSSDGQTWISQLNLPAATTWTPIELDLTTYAAGIVWVRFTWLYVPHEQATDFWQISDVWMMDILPTMTPSPSLLPTDLPTLTPILMDICHYNAGYSQEITISETEWVEHQSVSEKG